MADSLNVGLFRINCLKQSTLKSSQVVTSHYYSSNTWKYVDYVFPLLTFGKKTQHSSTFFWFSPSFLLHSLLTPDLQFNFHCLMKINKMQHFTFEFLLTVFKRKHISSIIIIVFWKTKYIFTLCKYFNTWTWPWNSMAVA